MADYRPDVNGRLSSIAPFSHGERELSGKARGFGNRLAR
jgi:hypothetical protein